MGTWRQVSIVNLPTPTNTSLSILTILFALRALVSKNQTNSKFRGKGEKFDFFLILILDRQDYN